MGIVRLKKMDETQSGNLLACIQVAVAPNGDSLLGMKRKLVVSSECPEWW
jgi:hypothetical protein